MTSSYVVLSVITICKLVFKLAGNADSTAATFKSSGYVELLVRFILPDHHFKLGQLLRDTLGGFEFDLVEGLNSKLRTSDVWKAAGPS